MISGSSFQDCSVKRDFGLSNVKNQLLSCRDSVVHEPFNEPFPVRLGIVQHHGVFLRARAHCLEDHLASRDNSAQDGRLSQCEGYEDEQRTVRQTTETLDQTGVTSTEGLLKEGDEPETRPAYANQPNRA